MTPCWLAGFAPLGWPARLRSPLLFLCGFDDVTKVGYHGLETDDIVLELFLPFALMVFHKRQHLLNAIEPHVACCANRPFVNEDLSQLHNTTGQQLYPEHQGE